MGKHTSNLWEMLGRDSAVSIVTRLFARRQKSWLSSRQSQEIILFSMLMRPAIEPLPPDASDNGYYIPKNEKAGAFS